MKAKNPWLDLPLDIYINHMGHSQVLQYQAINGIMQMQAEFAEKNKVNKIAILGITDGNGLQHFSKRPCFQSILALDINPKYLIVCEKTYGSVLNSLHIKSCDLTLCENAIEILSGSDMVIANLVLEHVGIAAFLKVIAGIKENLNFLSLTIQQNNCNGGNVSKSGYENAFDSVGDDMHLIDPSDLTGSLKNMGYMKSKQTLKELPNDKRFLTMDFIKSI
jgi:hypothetical protein